MRLGEVGVGVDDAVIEAIGAGATGWIAGLANALPRESVDLFNYGMSGENEKAFELYRWFLPLPFCSSSLPSLSGWKPAPPPLPPPDRKKLGVRGPLPRAPPRCLANPLPQLLNNLPNWLPS